jgi:hypothetical protein
MATAEEVQRVLGGARWHDIDRRMSRDCSGALLQQAKGLVSDKPHERGLAAALLLELDELEIVSPRHRVQRLSALAESFLHISSQLGRSAHHAGGLTRLWLAELALRIASSPEKSAKWAGANLEMGLSAILDAPALSRAARFLTLAIDCRSRQNRDWGHLYSGWEWE